MATPPRPFGSPRASSPLPALARLLPPETAHDALLALLARSGPPRRPPPFDARLRTRLFGQNLPHPIGVAAGFDKDARAVGGLLRLGFAAVEIGTVTPRPQAGNPKPRVFRLAEDRAVINRLGFNNGGAGAAARRLAVRPAGVGLVGANIGMNKDAREPVADYAAALATLYPVSDYVTVNVSSPNTAGLRDLQGEAALRALLSALVARRDGLAGVAPPKPLVVKIAPDLTEAEEEAIAKVVGATGVDGLIVSNTTVGRPPSLQSRFAAERGGLSGAPLLAPSTAMLRRFRRRLGPGLPLIGAGGVFTGADAYAKIKAGASLVQLYTGIVYRGPTAGRRIAEELTTLLARDGATVAEALGAEA